MGTNNRVTVFVGNYGSGKTELSINYALDLARQGQQVALVDLDIINPYFRSREKADLLESQGVHVVLPPAEYVMSEVPAMPPEVAGFIANKDYHVVIDVGGDNTGATALGRFADLIKNTGYRMLMVVNTNRPDTASPAGIITVMHSIEAAGGLSVTALVSNTNLAWETDLELVQQGQKILEQVSLQTGLPIDFIVVERSLYEQVKEHFPHRQVFPIDIMMRLQWAQT
ncbi:hypothetical protein [Desulforamulus putei]|uniref:CobQ/CobB/MinD/ParA nucleotide binding domain-containing protein n=1 Tax=Desulforamulus putei DSM 12395 TaxID=1121429 RepID=A0A1M4VTT4_9FIRM|nr:hypothetical protein [Desulforamulus putei]SHE72379.1 hypothetical protein SAMN02745133_00995 [Desulforamulus putei DSM 12395]